jgi:membrane fusion protein
MTTLIGGAWNDLSPKPCVSIREAKPAPTPVRRQLDVSVRHCVQLTAWPSDALSAFELAGVTAGAAAVAASAPELLGTTGTVPLRRLSAARAPALSSASPPAPPRLLTPLPRVVTPAAQATPPEPPRAPLRVASAVPAAPAVPVAPAAPAVQRTSDARRIETVSIDAELPDDSNDVKAAAQPLEAKLGQPRLIPLEALDAEPGVPKLPQAKPAGERPPLFRKAALDAHYGKTARLGSVEPKAGAWSVLLLLTSLVGALFLGAGLLTVEMTVKAPGALRAPNGLRSVASVLSGAVTDVLLHAGDDVTVGQVVVRLEEMQLRASLTLREQELATLRHDTLAAARADEALIAETTLAVREQRAALERRRSINRAQLSQRAERLGSSRQMLQAGVASAVDMLSVNESVQAAAESIAVVGSQSADLALGMADRRREWKQRELDRSSTLQRAIAAVEEARSLLAMTEIRSPSSGRIESLLVDPGSVVQAGSVMAQIVPKDAPRAIVAFLPSRETAFVAIGTQANVEVESLPVAEFGMARAQVTRISTDIAKPEEIASAFGEALAGSFVRVELTLIENDAQAKMAPHIRSGERVIVRLHRREQRVIALVFEFVRKWLGQ